MCGLVQDTDDNTGRLTEEFARSFSYGSRTKGRANAIHYWNSGVNPARLLCLMQAVQGRAELHADDAEGFAKKLVVTRATILRLG
jgi:hypothetical protein